MMPLKNSLSGLAHESEFVPSYLDLIFVARAFERVADNATKIAEDSFRRDQAEHIRQTYGSKKDIVPARRRAIYSDIIGSDQRWPKGILISRLSPFSR